MASSLDILEEVGAAAGWTQATMLELTCRYIDNQQDEGAFEDFLLGQLQEEEEADDEEA